jgi:hypothetical protein
MYPPSPAVKALLKTYARIAQGNPRTHSDDETPSLRYYRTEIAILQSPHEYVDSTDQVARWIVNLHTVEAFTFREGDLPRENNRAPQRLTSSESRRLARWLRYQRQALRAGDFRCTYQRRRLECIPGFTATPPDDQWDGQFVAYHRFLEANGYTPRERSDDEDEARSARWAVRQRLLFRRGNYDPDRAEALSRLNSWTWG